MTCRDKFSLTVCLPPTPSERVPTALDAVMAPFDVLRSGDYNPDGEWDYRRLETQGGFGHERPPCERTVLGSGS